MKKSKTKKMGLFAAITVALAFMLAGCAEPVNNTPDNPAKPNTPVTPSNPVATISIQDFGNPINIAKNYLWVDGSIDYNQLLNYQIEIDITNQFTTLPKAGDTITFT